MKSNTKQIKRLILTATGLLMLGQAVQAQTFNPNYFDELCLGLRENNAGRLGNYEVVVDIGPVSTYTGLTAGSSLTVSAYQANQLVTNAFSDFTYLNFSVLGAADNSLPGVPLNTLYVTVPRPSFGTQSTPPTRLSKFSQQNAAGQISSIFYGGQQLSSQSSSSTNNTSTLVREPINNNYDLTYYIQDLASSTNSSLDGSWEENVENITPSPFTTAIRSDLYEVRPTGVTDPHTGLTSGPAYYVGYFTFNTNGTMTFTRAVAYVAPAAPKLSIVHNGSQNVISFATTSGATYTLYYTNLSAFKTPINTWASFTTNVTGNGSTESFIDTAASSNRVYAVTAH